MISGWERGTGNPSFLNIYKLCQFFDTTLDEFLGVEKQTHVTLIVNQDIIEKLFATIHEFEDALAFIFPTQETKLHQKWDEIKQIIKFVFYGSGCKEGEYDGTARKIIS